jgi:biopolymer transport protein ExbD
VAKLKKSQRRGAGADEDLNINSMMDIMVIILVFLLKSYSTEDISVQASEFLELPTSTSQKSAEMAVNVIVSRKWITVDGQPIADETGQPLELETVDDPENPGETIMKIPEQYLRGQLIGLLHTVLQEKAKAGQAMGELTGRDELGFQGRVLLQADHRLPFEVVRQVMYTAGQAQFGEFRFVVYKQE